MTAEEQARRLVKEWWDGNVLHAFEPNFKERAFHDLIARLTPIFERAAVPSIRDCLAHRCSSHRDVPPLNHNEASGAECGACLAGMIVDDLKDAVERAERAEAAVQRLREIWKRRDFEDAEWWDEMSEALAATEPTP